LAEVALEGVLLNFQEFYPTIEFQIKMFNRSQADYVIDYLSYEVYLNLPTLKSEGGERKYEPRKIGEGLFPRKIYLGSGSVVATSLSLHLEPAKILRLANLIQRTPEGRVDIHYYEAPFPCYSKEETGGYYFYGYRESSLSGLYTLREGSLRFKIPIDEWEDAVMNLKLALGL
jgi:hypothetical protein